MIPKTYFGYRPLCRSPAEARAPLSRPKPEDRHSEGVPTGWANKTCAARRPGNAAERHTAGAAVCPKATCANTMYSVTATSATAAKEANTAAGVMMMMMTRHRDVGNRESRGLVSRPRRARKTSFSLPPCKVEQPREGVSGARRGQTAGGRRRQSRLARFVRARLDWQKSGSKKHQLS